MYGQNSKSLRNLQSDLPLLPKRMKVKQCRKLVCHLYDKEKHVIYIRTVNEVVKHGLILKAYRE